MLYSLCYNKHASHNSLFTLLTYGVTEAVLPQRTCGKLRTRRYRISPANTTGYMNWRFSHPTIMQRI
jgi:hypothetical protein